MNNVVLVGRLTEQPVVEETESGKKVTYVNVAVSRNYKNSDGIYETDFIRCVLWNLIAENAAEYCKTGDVIGIKGRLQTSSYQDSEGNKKYVMEVIAERITFLSSSKNKETDEEPTKDKKSASKKTKAE